MKANLLVVGFSLFVGLSAMAQTGGTGNGDVGSANNGTNGATNGGNVVIGSDGLRLRFLVIGAGKYVCSAENSFGEIPVLGRGQSLREAQILAKQECVNSSGSDPMFCKVTACETDTVNGNNVSVAFDITRDKSLVKIGFSGNAKYSCVAEAWGYEYVATAPTKTEAAALVKYLCAEDEGVRKNQAPNGFFCKVESCEQIEGVRGGFSIGDIFKRIKKN